MRVCDLTTLYLDGGQGGVNTYLYEKARDFAGRPDLDHWIIVPGRRDSRRRLFDSTVVTVQSPALPGNPEHRVLARPSTIRRALHEANPDVVEVDCASLLGRIAASLPRRAAIVGFYHVHLPSFIARPAMSRFAPRLGGLAERLTWRYVDHCHRACHTLVVSSHDMLQRLRARGLERLQRVPLGVNLELFRPRPPEPRPPGPRQVLHVGRLAREKQLPTLLTAFSSLPDPDLRLSVVGDGPLRHDLERQAARDPRIQFLGALPYGEELARRYAAADVVALPSPNETFGLTVLEALAADVPVVAVDQGGPRELVTPDAGALAPPNDPPAFARALARVLDRPPPHPRRSVASRYSWSHTFERLLDVYDHTLRAPLLAR